MTANLDYQPNERLLLGLCGVKGITVTYRPVDTRLAPVAVVVRVRGAVAGEDVDAMSAAIRRWAAERFGVNPGDVTVTQ